jgi:hypothetical protein
MQYMDLSENICVWNRQEQFLKRLILIQPKKLLMFIDLEQMKPKLQVLLLLKVIGYLKIMIFIYYVFQVKPLLLLILVQLTKLENFQEMEYLVLQWK